MLGLGRRLPAPLTIIEERTVGPGLGQDSIDKGKIASYVGSLLVVIFMFATYGLFGLFANIAVAVNVAMIFGVLSFLDATLTLPGIAGIVLTVGIAVDSNVLIYERIREEVRAGRSPIAAIDAGFTRALATILDSNITTFIAAAVDQVFTASDLRSQSSERRCDDRTASRDDQKRVAFFSFGCRDKLLDLCFAEDL